MLLNCSRIFKVGSIKKICDDGHYHVFFFGSQVNNLMLILLPLYLIIIVILILKAQLLSLSLAFLNRNAFRTSGRDMMLKVTCKGLFE